MNKNETFGIVAREYLARNGYGLQLHDIDKEVDSVILAAQQSDKEEKLNSAEKEDAGSPSGKPTEQSDGIICQECYGRGWKIENGHSFTCPHCAGTGK